MKTYTINKLTADIILPNSGRVDSVTYILDAFRQDFTKFPDLTHYDSAFVFLSGMDWDNDLSPWPAAPLYKKAAPFGGKGDDFLAFLLNDLMPAVEAEAGIAPKERCLVGVSLAGLFAVHAACKTDAFSSIASISGSLWYDGLPDFLETHTPSPTLKRAYFSVGSKEKKTKNPRMMAVEDRTKEIAALWEKGGVETIFELNPGNHFVDGELRIMKALDWLRHSSMVVFN